MSTIISPSAMVGNDAVGSSNGPWDDNQGRISLGDAVANPTYEAFRDTSWKTYFLKHNQADELHFSLQMPHSWDPTTAVKFHVHYVPMADPLTTKVFALSGQYSWATFGVATPANTGWTSWAATKDVASGDEFKEAVIQCFTATPPATATESSILLIYMKRDIATDTYETSKTGGTAAANVAILSADAHFEKNKDGTATEF